MSKIDRRTLNVAIVDGVLTPSPRTIYDTDHTEPNKQPYQFAGAIPPNVANNLREGSWDEPQVNPNEILHNILDHIHDGNREELVGELILMLGWLHKGGTMPNISKDTVTSTTLWIIPTND